MAVAGERLHCYSRKNAQNTFIITIPTSGFHRNGLTCFNGISNYNNENYWYSTTNVRIIMANGSKVPFCYRVASDIWFSQKMELNVMIQMIETEQAPSSYSWSGLQKNNYKLAWCAWLSGKVTFGKLNICLFRNFRYATCTVSGWGKAWSGPVLHRSWNLPGLTTFWTFKLLQWVFGVEGLNYSRLRKNVLSISIKPAFENVYAIRSALPIFLW